MTRSIRPGASETKVHVVRVASGEARTATPVIREPMEVSPNFQPERGATSWRRGSQASATIKLYIAEQQQILRQAYQSFFQANPSIEVVGTSGNTDAQSLMSATAALQPDVVLLGVKLLQPQAVERLDVLREACPDVAIVLLSASYDVQGIKALREFSRGATNGCAYLLKHTIDTVE